MQPPAGPSGPGGPAARTGSARTTRTGTPRASRTGTRKPARADAELTAVLAGLPREADGTVPIRRATAALGCGPDRARRLLAAADLLRAPTSTPAGTPAAIPTGPPRAELIPARPATDDPTDATPAAA